VIRAKVEMQGKRTKWERAAYSRISQGYCNWISTEKNK